MLGGKYVVREKPYYRDAEVPSSSSRSRHYLNLAGPRLSEFQIQVQVLQIAKLVPIRPVEIPMVFFFVGR